MKAAFYTLGCKVNQYESNEMAIRLKNNGFTLVSPKEEADVYIINSCTVTAESSRKSRQAVRRLKNAHPQSVVVLTGCYPQAFEEEVRQLTDADIVLGTNTNTQLLDRLQTFLETGARSVNVEPHVKNASFVGDTISDFEGHTRAFIKIQDGCNRRCTYCIIPKSRGFSRSKPLEAVKKELADVAENGYKEVVFVGINLSSYGMDCGLDLADAMLLAERLPGIERIRLGSLEPDHISDDLIEKLQGLTKFCPQFHLSLQSGSNAVLKRMNRHYTADEYELLCDKLKKAFPDLTLTTDIIVGFPGETETEFEETAAFVRQIGFMKVHIFPFSAREGTPAYTMQDKINNTVKGERCTALQTLCEQQRFAFLQAQAGKTFDVLFETPKNGIQTGYTKQYIPVQVIHETPLTGRILHVTVTGAERDACVGKIVF